MNEIFIILGSIVVSLSIDTMTELNMFKEIANKGYKINMSELYRFINKSGNKSNFLLLFIPGINIIYLILKIKKIDEIKKDLLSKLDDSELFIKMTDEEYESFLDNPKSTTAFNISVDYALKKENVHNETMKPVGFIKISNGNYRQNNVDGSYNDITFRKEDDKIVVTSMFGVIASLDDDEEQLKELNKIFKTLYKRKVVIEKKTEITLQKEALIEHRDEVLSYIDNDEYKLSLK